MVATLDRFLAILAVFAVLATPAFATDRYVAPWGSDSHPGTAEAPWRTIGKANTTALSGDTVSVEAGSYVDFPDPANKFVTFIAAQDVVVPGGRMDTPNTTVIGFVFTSSVSIWGNGCTLASSMVTGRNFALDNFAGVEDVTLSDCSFDLRNPGSADFLVRFQPEFDARIRKLTVERCRFVMTTLPGQPVDQKICMLNRLEGATFRRNLWLFRDSTGADVGGNVRQGFLVRDGIAGNLWDGDTIRAVALLGGRGNAGIDLTSSGNSIPGGGNVWRDLVIEQETSAYCQFQWKMQPEDRMQNCRVTSSTGFRISGVDGTARVDGNTFISTGEPPALMLGGSGQTSGGLVILFNELHGRTGIEYDLGSNDGIRSDWNRFVDCEPGSEVIISGVPGSLASACARGWECHSKVMTSAAARAAVTSGPSNR